jgi:hypothetical protein
VLLVGLPAAPASATSASRVSARLSANGVHPGDRVTVTGRATPGAGRVVSLQQRAGSGWATVRSTRTGRSGSYSLPVASTWTGSGSYRVHLARAGAAAGADSPGFTFTVTGRGSSADVTYLSGSSTSPARWDPCRTIGYRVNTTLATRGALSDVLGAMARVNRVSGLHLTYRGSTRIVPTGRNGGSYPADTDIVVAWARPGQTAAIASNARQVGTGGASWRSWRLNGRTYRRMDTGMVLLSTRSNTLAGGFGAGPTTGWLGTRGQLLMHEIAHAAGLNHARGTSQVMYPMMTRKLAAFGAGDASGLRKVGRAAGCFPASVARALSVARPDALSTGRPGAPVPGLPAALRTAAPVDTALAG